MTLSNTTAFCFLVFIGLFASCKKSDPISGKGPLGGGYSILVHNGNLLISGFRAENGKVNTKYWVNGKNADQAAFESLIQNKTIYRRSIDEKSRIVYSYKDAEGALQNYQFDQGSLLKDGKIFYYKNDVMVEMEEEKIGNISSVDFLDEQALFAGYLGKVVSSETGEVLRPTTPFIWDGNSSMHVLPLPEQAKVFHGVSTVYAQSKEVFYVSGQCGFPMYWKNNEPIILDDRYGEVWQITSSNKDVYAVGLLNKYKSNSTGHTACYWKNGVLHELEDHAQAYGILVDGNDIYICGATGSVPTQYRPCYWKNGVRYDLSL